MYEIVTREVEEKVNRRIPGFGKNLRYDSSLNMIINQGWTSGLDHHYFQGIRANDRFAVVCSFGLSSWGTLYLNKVDVYCNDRYDSRLVGTREFDTYSFSNDRLVMCCTDIVKGYVAGQVRLLGATYTDQRILSEARQAMTSLCGSNPKLICA